MNFAPRSLTARKPIEMENASVRRLRSIAVHFNGGVALVSPASGVPPPSVAAKAKDMMRRRSVPAVQREDLEVRPVSEGSASSKRSQKAVETVESR